MDLRNSQLKYSRLYRVRNIKDLADILETSKQFLTNFQTCSLADLRDENYGIYWNKKRYIEASMCFSYDLIAKKLTFNNKNVEVVNTFHYRQIEAKTLALKMKRRATSFWNKLVKTRTKEGDLKTMHIIKFGLKEVQRVIHEHLTFRVLDYKKNQTWHYEFPEYVHSGVRARSPITAHKYLGDVTWQSWDSFDLSKFFQTITFTQVKNFFRDVMKCQNQVAVILAKLCCFDAKAYHELNKGTDSEKMLPNYHLLTGSPCSVVLSFLIFKQQFDQIDRLCKENNAKFALYCDDITVTNSNPDIKKQIYEILESKGLMFNTEKETHQPAHARYKTALGIRQSVDGKLAPGKKFNKKFHDMHNPKPENKTRQIEGMQRYYKYIQKM
jgi:hypothetical protein